jgi:mercuric ion transport protein
MSGATKTGKVSMSAGLLAAIASSICCIGPLVAGIAGISGAASSFSWMEPLRPYLIGFTVLTLGFAFYQAYKPKKAEADCCAVEEVPKKRFFQTKGFLWGVTAFFDHLSNIPYYNGIFYAKTPAPQSAVFNQSEHFQVTFSVEGMTCSGCEHHIEGDLGKTEGVLTSNASYDDGTTDVTFDGSKVSKEKVIEVINATGYAVTGEINNETTNDN